VTKMEFEFDKFMKDLEKREENAQQHREMSESDVEYHQRVMQRNFRGRELHNNRIVWRR